MTHLDGEPDGGDPPAVEPVGGRTGQRQEDQRRQELDEAEQTEGELAVGDVEELLAERGRLEEHPDRRRSAGDEERDDRAVGDELASRRRDRGSSDDGPTCSTARRR